MAIIGTTENKRIKAERFSSVAALPMAASYGEGLAMIGQAIYLSDGATWTNDLGLSVKPLPDIWYVNTSLTAAGNGSPGTPFNLLQAAINAAAAFDTILVTTNGIHAENITMQDLDGITILGNSEVTTIIQNVGASHTFTWVPGATTGAAVNSFVMSHIEFMNTDNTGTYHAIHIDANAVASPNTFGASEIDFNFVDISGAGVAGQTTAYFRNLGIFYWTHGAVTGGDLVATNCSTFRTRQVGIGTLAVPTNFSAEYAGANPCTGAGRSDYTISQQTVVWGNLVLLGHPIMQVDQSCLVVGSTIGTLTSYYASGKDYCPIITLYGQHGLVGGAGGAITLTFPDPQTSGTAFNFLDIGPAAHIEGVVSLTKTNFLPATARGVAVVNGSGHFDLTTASVINISGYIALNMRGGTYTQSAMTVTGAATVDRDVTSFVQTIAASPDRSDYYPAVPNRSYVYGVGLPVSSSRVRGNSQGRKWLYADGPRERYCGYNA